MTGHFRVTIVVPYDKEIQVFECDADNWLHAMVQAKREFPDGEIANVEIIKDGAWVSTPTIECRGTPAE